MSEQTDGRRSPEQANVPENYGEPSIRRVAVVAVHGVAKHPAGETQNAMADLLLSLPVAEYQAQRFYQPFRSVGLQIPLQPVRTGHEGRAPAPKRRWFNLFDLYQERSADFAQRLPREAGVPLAVGEVATEYNDLLLADYEGAADTNAYVTSRLEGQRGKDGPEVHIYEVLWSDLAKPDSSAFSFFLASFQLLLHLASLSRTAIDTGAAERRVLPGKCTGDFSDTQCVCCRFSFRYSKCCCSWHSLPALLQLQNPHQVNRPWLAY